MMSARKLLQKDKILSYNCTLKRYLKESTASGVNPYETHFEPLPKKKPERQSYLMSLILRNCDKECFTFPEQASLRYQDFYKWIQPIENYINNCKKNKTSDKHEILDQLRELEVFRTHINDENFGLTLSKTESLKLVETLSNIPWLGTYILKNHILPVEMISKYGSKSQKIEYFSRIMSGELVPTICIYEDDSRTNINNIKSYAVRSEKDSWLLNGEKAHVVNGINSNLFLVFAKTSLWKSSDTEETIKNSFSLFLVERDFGGVTCSDIYETVGRHETPSCTINFQNTEIPNTNMIGERGSAFNILMDFIKPGNKNIAGQAISILRNFINQLIPDILTMKHFDRNLYEFDIVKKSLGEMIFCLYTMESMAYLTTGLIDQYESQSSELERIITEIYCADKCFTCIQEGLQLVGAQSYLNNKSYMQAFHDAAALITMDTNNIDAITYAAVHSLKHVGKHVRDHVFKKRNSFDFPMYSKLISLFDKSNVRYLIREHIHPSLKLAAEYLDNGLDKFSESIVTVLENSGSQVVDRYSDLQRVTDMLTEVYVIYVNLLRSSRSYSIGVRNSDYEKDIATNVAYISYAKICAIANEIETDLYRAGDNCYTNIATVMFEKHKYPMEHPLTKTF